MLMRARPSGVHECRSQLGGSVKRLIRVGVWVDIDSCNVIGRYLVDGIESIELDLASLPLEDITL